MLRVGAALAVVLLPLVVFGYLRLRNPLPAPVAGDADALARRMIASVDGAAWARTGAVRWTFFDGARHLWDRARNLDRYTRGDVVVLLDLSTRRGVATRGGVTLAGADRDAALALAWKRWCNDAFWLNPMEKLFDAGVTRSLVRDDAGRSALLLSYRAGGVTPGDRYLWMVDDDGRPRAWRMWVSVIPVPGLEATWGAWRRLATGAWVSTEHRMGPVTQRIRDVEGAETLARLAPGRDPFAALSP